MLTHYTLFFCNVPATTVIYWSGHTRPNTTLFRAESFTNPPSMYLRNRMAMDAEEMLRAQPMDAVILRGGCDKTVPALLMGAASANVPAIMLVTGPTIGRAACRERVCQYV